MVVLSGRGSVMACIDIDALAEYEVAAKQGRPDALYNLGLAYSTGQGVGVDFVAAHKWFNLAAMKGIDEAKSWRASIAKEMNTAQIAEAQRLAREWLSIVRLPPALIAGMPTAVSPSAPPAHRDRAGSAEVGRAR